MKSVFVLFALITVLSAQALAFGSSVKSYRVTFLECQDRGTSVVGMREFSQDGQKMRLLLDPRTLQTRLEKAADLNCGTPSPALLKGTAYESMRSLAAATKNTLANAGISHLNSSKLFLTVDMCPSNTSFERNFFDWVQNQKIPYGISISGGWIHRHGGELREVLRGQNQITWINHTLTHPYVKRIPEDHNFLLMKNVDLEKEIIGNEIVMIEAGLTPSVFVRFPGLISDAAVIDRILNWGLIPLGADAWLGKGQKAHPGSVILVHGNGNEPKGIDLFFKSAREFLSIGFGSLTPY